MSGSDPGAVRGCCAGLVPATPIVIENRPGLTAVAYRVGTHSQFKASLLARLAASAHPALQRLTTRRDDDFAIALCDAWATVADVLTFYQERIANEAFLRTATERRSVAELAGQIGYALRPGVAASTHLAFNLEIGAGAPSEVKVPAGTRVMSVPGPGEKPQTFETVADVTARGVWNRFTARRRAPGSIGATSATFAGAALGLAVGDRLLFVGAGRVADPASTDWHASVITRLEVDRDHDRTTVEWADALPALGPPVQVYALRQRAALVGSTAPDPKNLADTTRGFFAADINLSGSTPQDWKFTVDSNRAYVDGVYPGVRPGDLALFDDAAGGRRLFDVTAASIVTQTAYTLSARSTRLTLEPGADVALFYGAHLRATTVFLQHEALEPAEVEISAAVEGDGVEIAGSANELPAGRLVLLQGVDADTGASAGETATLSRVEASAGGDRLVFEKNLTRRYDPQSLVVNGNVAPATHGETVRETLGGGDGSTAYQRMKLRQAPLTYVAAKSPTGAASTLELRVNGVLWSEVPTLYAAGPDDRAYITRQEEDGSTVIQFGDGKSGARLPSGQENVSAAYRKGTGPEGLLQAGQLSQLITRPLGVKDGLNPLPTSGAEEPESVDTARANCTLTIHALDRVVSLQDYEDWARAFGGIAKALATWFWDGKRRGVFLTVAGPAGAAIPDASETRANLIASLRQWGDRHVPVDVRSYAPGSFAARLALAPAPDRLRDEVRQRVRTALLARFGAGARRFAQAVTIDEVLAVAQSAEGVAAANVLRLSREGLEEVVPRLVAAGPSLSGAVPVGAELLTLDPAQLELTDLS